VSHVPTSETSVVPEAESNRAEQVEAWFTTPVIVAALASVPAMFLTTMEGHAETVGSALNYATMAVFIAETLVLLAFSTDRLEWLRKHRFVVAVTLLTIPAVVFAVGPIQIFRLIRLVGALRIVRVRRVLKAGLILRKRAQLSGRAWQATAFILSLAAAIFVGFILADPSSTSRRTIDATVGRIGFFATLVAAAILALATYVVARTRRQNSQAKSAASERRGSF